MFQLLFFCFLLSPIDFLKSSELNETIPAGNDSHPQERTNNYSAIQNNITKEYDLATNDSHKIQIPISACDGKVEIQNNITKEYALITNDSQKIQISISARDGENATENNITKEYALMTNDSKKIQIPIRARDGKVAISNRSDDDDEIGENNNHHKEIVKTYDNYYYDWGFSPDMFPGVAIPDARIEGITTTDISCWDCDEETGKATLSQPS